MISAQYLYGTVVEQLVVEDVPLLEEDLALVVHELALGLLAARAACAMRLNAESWMTLISSFWSLRSLASSADSICLARSSFSTPLRREDLGVDDGAHHARGDAQRAVAHVAGLLAEDGAQQLLLGRELGLALRSDLADQHVAGLHLGADADDAALVEVLEGLLTDVRDVAGDLFLAQLGVARDALELLDVDRGEDVLLERCAR